jgi:Fic family protein
LLDDLIAYVNRDDVEPVSQAAIAHAQFEFIHPFADGNGHVIIAWTVSGSGRAQQELVASVEQLQRAWRGRPSARGEGAKRLRSNAAAWRVLDLLPRHVALTSRTVAAELAIPQKSVTAALRDLVDAGVLVDDGMVQAGRGRPSRLYTSAELRGLAGSSPLRP